MTWYDSPSASLPALLRHARSTYRMAIHLELLEAGCEDVPANGIYVLGAVSSAGAPLADIIRQLGLSKQAAGQLVDTLVIRGYLERTPDTDDRRRLNVLMTERGLLAASASRRAIASVDDELESRIGAQSISQARVALAALIQMGEEETG